jgi:NADP-dependent 3-hydroxy acid dehydrogenase YdfG
LPPFLPEEWAGVDGVGGGGSVAAAAAASNFKIGRRSHDAASASKKVDMEHGTDSSKNSDSGDGEVDSQQSPHHLWDPFQSFGTISSAYRTWLEGHNMQNKQLHQQRRIQVRDQLLMLKKTSSMSASNSTSTSSATTNNSDMGYALVTGASSGIGRALAVELARYQIPLILVARDLSRLRSVAEDIETHYDVPCRILRADLSSPDSASRIHAATKSAGLNVDILVNNAGVCTHGDFVDGDERDMAQMMLVNIGAVTQLSRLYGEDMKERRRGRILFVSSMCGVLPGNPGVAVYAASTAYKKSLAISLGREMER